MATNIKYAQVQSSALDFDAIKASLKTYLQTQDVFQDYNFEGSSMNILLDVLAANTHYYAIYNSMIANEMFLDTAILRSNVVSNAKNLGYTPRSNVASKANITVQIDAKNNAGQPLNLGNYITIPKGTQFNSSVDGTQYRFITMKEYVLSNTAPGQYANGNVDIYEGTLLRKSFTVTNDPNQKFKIPDSNVDTSSMRVWIQESVSNLAVTEYRSTTSILGLTSADAIYMVQESADGNFEIVFGDNIIGKQPVVGNIITVEYLSTSAGQGDGCSVFSLVQLIIAGQTHTVSMNRPAAGASVKEAIDSIKLHARYNFESQGRSVIPADYKTHVLQAFPELLDVNVWGGEDNVPPQYGRVFISALSRHLTKITQTKKNEIIAAIKKLNVLNIVPVIVDPTIITLKLEGTVNYKESVQNIVASEVVSQVITGILQYNTDNLQKFNSSFSYSKALSYVDAAVPSIVNSFLRVSMRSPIVVTSGTTFSWDINFGNAIRPNSLVSDPFKLSQNSLANTLYYFEDDGLGGIELYGIINGDSATKFYSGELHGTVNYTTGVVNLINLQLSPYLDPYNIFIQVEPMSYDVKPVFNQILTLSQSQILVSALPAS